MADEGDEQAFVALALGALTRYGVTLKHMNAWFTAAGIAQPEHLHTALSAFLERFTGIPCADQTAVLAGTMQQEADKVAWQRSIASDPLAVSGGFGFPGLAQQAAAPNVRLHTPQRDMYHLPGTPFHDIVCSHGYWKRTGDCWKCN